MIWVIGARGRLGSELCQELRRRGLPFVGSGRETSLCDEAGLAGFADERGVSCVVNCAGYTDVDRAEVEEDACRELNARGPERLARLCAERDLRLIHLSSDYVFDGKAGRPYREDDPVSPLSAYGRSKAEGEERVLRAYPRALVVRTAWLYGHYGRNFVSTMLRLIRRGGRIEVATNQVGSPTRARDLAEILASLAVDSAASSGILHAANDGSASRYELASAVLESERSAGMGHESVELVAVRLLAGAGLAPRPADSSLSVDRLKLSGAACAPWKTALELHLLEEEAAMAGIGNR